MSAYKFRVLIDTDKDEEIFRDIAIDPNDNFESFYQTIISSFEFAGDQLASFYGSNESWDKGQEVALMDMGMGNNEEVLLLMKETSVNELVKSTGDRLILVYDFLKMWCFLIELVEILPKPIDGPTLVLAVGDAPDENDKEVDFTQSMSGIPDLGNDIDDIFSDMDEDEDDFGNFENIDDFDI